MIKVAEIVTFMLSASVFLGCGAKGNKTGGTAAQSTVDGLVEAVRTQDNDSIDRAMEAIKRVGSPTVPLLVDRLKDSDELMRACAAQAIASLDMEGREAAPALVDALQDSSAAVRSWAARALGNIEADTPAAVDGLIETLSDSDLHARISAARSLRRLQAEGVVEHERLIEPLTQRLRDSNIEVRAHAGFTLGMMGRDARGAADALLKLAQEGAAIDRVFACTALGRIGEKNDAIVSALRENMNYDFAGVRVQAALALLRLNEDGGALELLLETLDKEGFAGLDSDEAAQALGELGESAREALPHLKSKFNDEDELLRVHACLAAWRIDPTEEPELPVLLDVLLASERGYIRGRAAWALSEMGVAASDAVPALITALQDTEESVRRWAASALGQIGSAAESALPALRERLNDDEPLVRLAASEAIEQIEASNT